MWPSNSRRLMRAAAVVVAFLSLLGASSGCVVRVRERPPNWADHPRCPGAVWVEEGHHSHWRCPDGSLVVAF